MKLVVCSERFMKRLQRWMGPNNAHLSSNIHAEDLTPNIVGQNGRKKGQEHA